MGPEEKIVAKNEKVSITLDADGNVIIDAEEFAKITLGANHGTF